MTPSTPLETVAARERAAERLELRRAQPRVEERCSVDAIEGVGRPDVLLEDGKGLDGSAGADGKERLVAQTERGDRVGALERDGVLGRDEEAVDDRLCAKGRARIGAERAVDEVERVKAEASPAASRRRRRGA